METFIYHKKIWKDNKHYGARIIIKRGPKYKQNKT